LDFLGGHYCKVYSAFYPKKEQYAVVKIAPFNDSSQLRRECDILSQFLQNCNGVPKIIESFYESQFFFLVEEPVGEILVNCDPTVTHLLDWAPKLIDILVEIHQHGVVHRDIKPSNIICTLAGEIVIIDFGVAAQTESQKAIGFEGTKEFASNNALEGENAEPNDDFESLCYTLYALEIGQRNWFSKVASHQRPTIKELKECSVVVRKLTELWEEKMEGKIQKEKKNRKHESQYIDFSAKENKRAKRKK